MKIRILIASTTLAVLIAGTSCQSKKSDVKKVSPGIATSVETDRVRDEIVKIVNSLPTNTETVNLINATGAAYLAGFTGEDLKTENLLTRADKAKAYGTIIFDLVYTHTYNQVESFSKLVKIHESLTKDLGFEELARSQKDFKERYQQNKDNADSIDFLVNEMLAKSNDFIHKNGSAVDVSLVFAGTVVKSLNVISYLTLFSTNKEKLLEILKNQKEVINATCNILEKSSADQDVSKLYKTLLPINNLFNTNGAFSVQTVEEINKLTNFISQ